MQGKTREHQNLEITGSQCHTTRNSCSLQRIIAEGSTKWGKLACLREYWLCRFPGMWVWELAAYAEGLSHYSVPSVDPCVLFLLPPFSLRKDGSFSVHILGLSWGQAWIYAPMSEPMKQKSLFLLSHLSIPLSFLVLGIEPRALHILYSQASGGSILH